jgi:hypothetical protein
MKGRLFVVAVLVLAACFLIPVDAQDDQFDFALRENFLAGLRKAGTITPTFDVDGHRSVGPAWPGR